MYWYFRNTLNCIELDGELLLLHRKAMNFKKRSFDIKELRFFHVFPKATFKYVIKFTGFFITSSIFRIILAHHIGRNFRKCALDNKAVGKQQCLVLISFNAQEKTVNELWIWLLTNDISHERSTKLISAELKKMCAFSWHKIPNILKRDTNFYLIS